MAAFFYVGARGLTYKREVGYSWVGASGITYDPSTAAAIPSGAGTVSATGTLTGTGYSAHSGAGSVSGAGALSGEGYAAHSGAGSVSATGLIQGEGAAPSAIPGGSGSVTATGALTGEGYAAHSGAGSVAGTAAIVGTGFHVASGSGSVTGTGLIVGGGPSAVVARTAEGGQHRDISDPLHPYWQNRIEVEEEQSSSAVPPAVKKPARNTVSVVGAREAARAPGADIARALIGVSSPPAATPDDGVLPVQEKPFDDIEALLLLELID